MDKIKVIVPPVINIGGNSVTLNEEQNKMLSEKIKLFGTEGIETKACIMQIVDENRNSESIPENSIVSAIKALNLPKPIIFFDTETTGLDVGNDRIVAIAVTKVMPDGEMISKDYLINPIIPISKEASDIHGITNDMVVDKPLINLNLINLQNLCILLLKIVTWEVTITIILIIKYCKKNF
jgi:hypothetical protein